MEAVRITPDMIRAAFAEATRPGSEFEIGTELIRGIELRVFKNIPRTLPEFYAAH